MKNKKIKRILYLIIILILCIFIFLIIKNKNTKFQNDLIFFKSFHLGENRKNSNEYNLIEILNSDNIIHSSINNQKEKIQQYKFYVSYKNMDFKDVNLSNTINKNTLINEKIAPGTSGSFEILLETNQKIKYEIKFESKNDKPQNLYFKIEGKDEKYRTLEEMEKDLKGEIQKSKKITIDWEWEYEGNNIQNIQDTNDGTKIVKYNFTIFALGYE